MLENNQPVVEETVENQSAEQEAFLRVKYNKEELALDQEKATELAQKGLNYDKIYEERNSLKEKWETNSNKIEFVDQFLKDNGYDSMAEYKKAIEIEKLVKDNLPKEFAEEMVESREFRERTQKEKAVMQKQIDQANENQEFLKAYPEVGLKIQERNLKGESIEDLVPQSVFDYAKEKGVSLTDAYTRHENTLLKAKLKEFESASNKNTENEIASTGSVTGNDSKETYFTEEQVRKMTTDEVRKNYKRVLESRKQWKK